MKNLKFLTLVIVFFIVNTSIYAQIRVNLKNKVENEANRRVNKKVDDAVNNTLDDVEGAIFGKKKDKENSSNTSVSESLPESENNTEANETNDTESQSQQEPVVTWSKFDFVPGDNIIFEDGPSADEENGEFPSRWDLEGGQVEIASINGEAVIMFLDGGEIVPYLKNSDKDYLPEVFTIEFDFYRPAGGNRITAYLTDQKNQRGKGVYDNPQEIEITPIRVDAPVDIVAEHSGRDHSYCEIGRWTHVSIAYTKGKLKIYLDDTRVINIPHYEFNPTGFTFQCYWADAGANLPYYAKNFRIAEGGVKYYDRAMQDGKIIVNGIRFDVGKATLKPESMGPINEIYDLMDKNPEINFSVEGHTDSDGNDETNQALSEERAKTVMNKLIEMGIDKSRLKSTGFGESKPIADNSSAEGKAQNRRVEFVKF
ncbi:MAG TPA: OmpA family protein [Bacteroidales bacterium]|nr:OmpA family protein [Bacteroidales bacterium]